jgi:hypothetical protein
MESVESFSARVIEHTGLSLASIPDAPPEELLGGSISCRRGDTFVVLKDPSYQLEDGTTIYSRSVVVGRSADLPLWGGDGDGRIESERRGLFPT